MDTGVPAAGPWTVLTLAVLALLGVGVLVLLARRPGARRPHPPPMGHLHDDLPRFLEHPPGTAPRPAGARSVTAPVSLAARGAVTTLAPPPDAPTAPPLPVPVDAPPSSVPPLAGLVAGALVLIALTAGVALLAPGGAEASPPLQRVSLPTPPISPTPGQGGAGELASITLPLGADGEAVSLRFGGVVLEPRAVGVTATYPTVGVTVAGGQTLAHVELPTWNCFSADAPTDPDAAGCVPSLTEYADLPSPALTALRSGRRLTLTGRFPTYTRPNGSAPEYTGRAYDLRITVAAGRDGRNGKAAATGTLALGPDTVRSTGDAVVRFGR